MNTYLQTLLASYSVFTQNVRDFHFYIRGKDFFILHEKFEELYESLSEKIDEIAELLLSVDENPETRFSVYLQTSKIGEVNGVSSGEDAATFVAESLQILIDLQQEILDGSEEECVIGMMSDNIREQKKLLWMYKAYLG